jgi:hypothetical protein
MFKIRSAQREAFAAAFGAVMEPCKFCLVVRFVEIKGLYQGGVDDREEFEEGTTKGASYVPGYASRDDRGRIFINRDLDGKWKRDTQGIEITVRVDPPSVPIPPGTEIEWTFYDPDDVSNQDPQMEKDAGAILDPNDYAKNKAGLIEVDDNDPNGEATNKAGFASVGGKFPLSGDKTPIDPGTRLSKVRFDVSNIAGDNYIVWAKITPKDPITQTFPAVTGIMTVWNRIDVEYVKMKSADDLPMSELPVYFDMAFAQIDVSKKREVKGDADKPFMGSNDKEADAACDDYASSKGQFTMEGKPGWFFVASASRPLPEMHEFVIYEGDAFAQGRWIRLPKGADLPVYDTPAEVRIFNPEKLKGVAKPWPANPDLYTIFTVEDTVLHNEAWWLFLEVHDFHEVDQPDTSFLDANLVDYGFWDGAPISIQVLSEGEETHYATGISPGGTKIGDHSYFGGKVIVFTKVRPADWLLTTLTHELCHAFDNSHKCGNRTWNKGSPRPSCAMCYLRAFLLDDKKPRKPVRWTQNLNSAHFCAQHLRRMRDYHLQDNPGLGWR